MLKFKQLLSLLFIILVSATARSIAPADIPNVHLIDRTQYVSDPSDILSSQARAEANAIIADMWQTTSAEPVVVIVDSLDGLDSFDAAMQLFNLWGVGKQDKNNGLIMLIDIAGRQGSLITGRGIEGVLPDVYCARIMRDIAFPKLREGDTDGAVISALNAIRDIVNDPAAVDELMSQYANDANSNKSSDNFFSTYLTLSAVGTLLMIIYLLFKYISTRSVERHRRFAVMQHLDLPYLMLTFIGLGIPIIAWGILKLMMHSIRRSTPRCDNCGHKMRLIDEVHDNDYLTPAQDREEQLNSVDYDVWHCDNCQHDLILPYVNPKSPYSVCPRCGSHAEQLISNRVIKQPTYNSEGIGEKLYRCRVCNNERTERYRIPPIQRPPSAGSIAAGAILGSAIGSALGGRGGGGFGGGISGGSFGGGSSAGGGYSGNW